MDDDFVDNESDEAVLDTAKCCIKSLLIPEGITMSDSDDESESRSNGTNGYWYCSS